MSDGVARTIFLNVPAELWMMRVIAESRAAMYQVDAGALRQ